MRNFIDLHQLICRTSPVNILCCELYNNNEFHDFLIVTQFRGFQRHSRSCRVTVCSEVPAKDTLNNTSHSFFLNYYFGWTRSLLQHTGFLLWQCACYSCCRLLALERSDFSSCTSWAQLPHGMWNLSSQIRNRIWVPCIGRRILNHWTTSAVLWLCFIFSFSSIFMQGS